MRRLLTFLIALASTIFAVCSPPSALGPGDDERQIAGRLARDAWTKARGTTDFNRPLGYQPLGVA